jgi:hypothetical protein
VNQADQEALAVRLHNALIQHNSDVVHATFTETDEGMPALIALLMDQPLHVVTEYRRKSEEFPTYRVRIGKKVSANGHEPYMYTIIMVNEADKEQTEYGTVSTLTGCDIALFVPHVKEDENVLYLLLQQYGFNTASETAVP